MMVTQLQFVGRGMQAARGWRVLQWGKSVDGHFKTHGRCHPKSEVEYRWPDKRTSILQSLKKKIPDKTWFFPFYVKRIFFKNNIFFLRSVILENVKWIQKWLIRWGYRWEEILTKYLKITTPCLRDVLTSVEKEFNCTQTFRPTFLSWNVKYNHVQCNKHNKKFGLNGDLAHRGQLCLPS